MDKSNFTVTDEDTATTDTATDGGYTHVNEGVGESLVRRLRSIGTRSRSTVTDRHVSQFDADGDVPAIVTWHELLQQGR